MSAKGVGELYLKKERQILNILKRSLLPIEETWGARENFIYQPDGACHKSIKALKWFFK